jgi:hypothetical protein
MSVTRKQRGYIRRAAYTRKTKSGTRVRVSSGLIKNVGRPGKGYRGPNGRPNGLRSPGIGPLREGELSQFGYTNVVKKSVKSRRSALKKAVKRYGSLSVRRKLQAVATYTKHTSPRASKVFKTDIAWIKRTL